MIYVPASRTCTLALEKKNPDPLTNSVEQPLFLDNKITIGKETELREPYDTETYCWVNMELWRISELFKCASCNR